MTTWPDGLELVGQDVEVPLVDGSRVRTVDLDRAATTSCLVAVKQAVDALLPYYGAPHRGAGYKAVITTRAYEQARASVASFVGAGPSDVVVFVRNTTEACNLMAAVTASRADVVCFELEHHADLLPWRRNGATVLSVPASGPDLLARLEEVVRQPRRRDLLVAMTGVSNVTGEVLPIEAAAKIAHAAGARLFVDAAQLAPHRALDMSGSGVDYLALSGHKLYAPFGVGALVGARDWLEEGEPMLLGGGMVSLVTSDDIVFKPAPSRMEAGTQNVIGAVALGVACDTLRRAGLDRLAEIESELTEELDRRLAAVPGIRRYSMWADPSPHIGVACFNLESYDHGLVASALSAEHGIGVRHGCFCAHLLVRELLGVTMAESSVAAGALRTGGPISLPGAVRASIGIGTTSEDLRRLAHGLEAISASGPRWTYRHLGAEGDYEPDPDPRPDLTALSLAV